eukprot:TRINITY_DN20795_c2_g1_i1.p1 TRINITY_DN20795_c2_g1~~TRINITY_DN20795_c2_g1_i1.p1  ORF type:complete len:271 (+),score=100.90 TRINITY_DN20795_c2_g1_i1:226-1038(+)
MDLPCALCCNDQVLNTVLHTRDVSRLLVKQRRASQDCAYACAATAINIVRHDRCAEVDDLKQVLVEGEPEYELTGGVWTIEILRLLELSLGDMIETENSAPRLRLSLTTSALGVNEDNAVLDFYRNGTFDEEAVRVDALFKRFAARKGCDPVVVRKAVVGIHDLVACLSNHADVGSPTRSLYIVLVNIALLRCLNPGCINRVVPQPEDIKPTSFTGHYIVALESCPHHIVFYHDPAAPCEVCCTTFATFDAARSFRGTDNDLLRVTWCVD